MSNEKHNFELVFPLNVLKFAFPATEKQKAAVSQFSTPYSDTLKCFVNQYNDKGKKVLLVVDDFITQSTNYKGDPEESDLDRNCIYSGKEGAGLQNIIAHAVGKLGPKTQLKQVAVFNWCFTEFHFPLNSKKGEHLNAINAAYGVFYDRLIDFIKRYKPDAVFISGVLAWEYFNGRMQNDTVTNQRMLMGRVMRGHVELPRTKWKPKLNRNKLSTLFDRHYFDLMGCIDCKKLVAWDVSAKKHPNLIGYWSDNLTQLINGRNRYKIGLPRDVRFININTLEKFDKLMRIIAKQKIVSIDTETEDLGRIKNTLYTVQFCYDGRVGYTIPIDHPDTPFTTQQRKYIKDKLKDYFEHGKSLYHIYQNGKFDIPVFFACCGVRFYNHRIFDIQAGEYCFHPNTFVDTEIGKVPIKELVNSENPPRVWSFNHQTQEKELKHIVNKSEHITEDRMMEIEYEDGSVQVTENHQLWCVNKNMYVKVKDLSPDDEILISENKPLIGKGDMNIL